MNSNLDVIEIVYELYRDLFISDDEFAEWFASVDYHIISYNIRSLFGGLSRGRRGGTANANRLLNDESLTYSQRINSIKNDKQLMHVLYEVQVCF
jgi:hypothetical protein